MNPVKLVRISVWLIQLQFVWKIFNFRRTKCPIVVLSTLVRTATFLTRRGRIFIGHHSYRFFLLFADIRATICPLVRLTCSRLENVLSSPIARLNRCAFWQFLPNFVWIAVYPGCFPVQDIHWVLFESVNSWVSILLQFTDAFVEGTIFFILFRL